jgi:hypothetical protein
MSSNLADLYRQQDYDARYPLGSYDEISSGNYNKRLALLDRFLSGESGALVPYIIAPRQHVSSILKEGYRPGAGERKGAMNTRKFVYYDYWRPEWANPDVSPIYGFIAPEKNNQPYARPDIIGNNGSIGGELVETSVIKMNPAILEKSTLSIGDSIRDWGKVPLVSADPENVRDLWDRFHTGRGMEKNRVTSPFVEFQYWGDERNPFYTIESVQLKSKPTDEEIENAKRSGTVLKWDEMGDRERKVSGGFMPEVQRNLYSKEYLPLDNKNRIAKILPIRSIF